MLSLAAQMRVVETEELKSRMALESTRDQLSSVSEQYSEARQHIALLEASPSLLTVGESGCKVLWWVRLSLCVSVCLSVCLSDKICLELHARSLPNFLCIRGLVLLRHLYDRPHCLSPGRDFLPHWHCTITCWQHKGSFRRCRVCWKWNRPGRGDGNAQCGRSVSVIYNCLVCCCKSCCETWSL